MSNVVEDMGSSPQTNPSRFFRQFLNFLSGHENPDANSTNPNLNSSFLRNPSSSSSNHHHSQPQPQNQMESPPVSTVLSSLDRNNGSVNPPLALMHANPNSNTDQVMNNNTMMMMSGAGNAEETNDYSLTFIYANHCSNFNEANTTTAATATTSTSNVPLLEETNGAHLLRGKRSMNLLDQAMDMSNHNRAGNGPVRIQDALGGGGYHVHGSRAFRRERKSYSHQVYQVRDRSHAEESPRIGAGRNDSLTPPLRRENSISPMLNWTPAGTRDCSRNRSILCCSYGDSSSRGGSISSGRYHLSHGDSWVPRSTSIYDIFLPNNPSTPQPETEITTLQPLNMEGDNYGEGTIGSLIDIPSVVGQEEGFQMIPNPTLLPSENEIQIAAEDNESPDALDQMVADFLNPPPELENGTQTEELQVKEQLNALVSSPANNSVVASVPMLGEEEFRETMVNWPEHHLVGIDRFGFDI